jgi:hypothetical protein
MSKSHVAILILPAAITLAACVESGKPVAEGTTTMQGAASPVLRVKEDRARGRRWELGWGTASAYDVGTGQLVRTVSLSGANLSAGHDACLPDMLLGRSGAVIVSSNAQPSIWRINAERFEIERYDIEVDSDQDKDFGFSGLAWSADEMVLYAVSAATGSMWSIDLASSKASKVELSAPVHGACGLARVASPGAWRGATTLVVTIEPTKTTRLVSITPDMARGKVEVRDETSLAAAN